ncbi:MAG: hypothetical protein AB1407_03230 [Spirochaetota bacterium]
MKSRLLSLLALLAVFGGTQAFASSSSCVDCHGNADLMKTMVPPPAASSGEGEG